MKDTATAIKAGTRFRPEAGPSSGIDGNFQVAHLPNFEEVQKLLAKLDDNILAAFAREALPEMLKALGENETSKLYEMIGDWIATFEEYAAPGAVDRIRQASKDIDEGKGISWENVQSLIETHR
jgi:hypothetical protein